MVDSFTWTGNGADATRDTGNDDWSSYLNWNDWQTGDPEDVPNDGDNVFIYGGFGALDLTAEIGGDGGAFNVSIDDRVEFLGSLDLSVADDLYLGDGSTLLVDEGAQLNVGGDIAVFNTFADGVGQLLQVDGNVKVSGSLEFAYYTNVTVSGSLSVESVVANQDQPDAFLDLTVNGSGAFTDSGAFDGSSIVAANSATVSITGASSIYASVTASNSATVTLDAPVIGGSFVVDGDSASITVNDVASSGEFALGGDVQASGSVNANDIVIGGTLEVVSGSGETLTGELSGDGLLLIDAQSTLNVDGALSSAAEPAIEFNGADGTLNFYDASTQAGTIPNAIKGFAAGDLIYLQGLQNAEIINEQVVAGALQLTLAGEFNGAALVSQLTLDNLTIGQVLVSQSQTGGTDIEVSSATPATAYDWTGAGTTNAWSDIGNWANATTGAAATQAPGSSDFVTLTGPTSGSPLVVTAPGAAQSLVLGGQVALQGGGAFAIATVSEQIGAAATVESGATLNSRATLTVSGDYVAGANATLTVSGSDVDVNGAYDENSGHTLIVENQGSFSTASVAPVGAASAIDASYDVEDSGFDDRGDFAGEGDKISVDGGSFSVAGAATLGGDTFTAARDGNDAGTISLTSIAAAASGVSSNTFTVVDNLSGIAIGGEAAQGGEFEIGAGQTLTGGGTITAPSIVIDGGAEILVGKGQSETLDGLLDGQGNLEIDDGLLSLGGSILGAPTVTFAGTSGTLVIAAAALDAEGAFVPVISGYAAGDAIELTGIVATSASLTNGVLTVLDGQTAVATLTLSGASLNGETFLVSSASGDSFVALSAGGDTQTPPAGTPTNDVYLWTGEAGSWDNVDNWDDVSSGNSPAASAPGVDDYVTISAPTTFTDIITGSGAAKTLALSGPIDLDGAFTVAQETTEAANAAVTVAAGATLSLAGLTMSGAALLSVAGAAAVTGNLFASAGDAISTSASGALTADVGSLGGASVTASGASAVTFDSLDTQTDAGDALDTNFTVGAAASVEIGTANDAQAGAFVLDSGQTLSGGGAITAAHIVLDDTLTVQAGDHETIDGELDGSGTLQIDADATLTLGGLTNAAATNTIAFDGSGATLTLSAAAVDDAVADNAGVIAPLIENFAAADAIDLQGLSDASIQSASVDGNGDTDLTITGTLNGASAAVQLTLQGNVLASPGAIVPQTDGEGGTLIQYPSGFYWVGDGGDDDWTTAGNWQYFGAGTMETYPSVSDPVTIAAPSGQTVQVSGPGAAGALTLDGSVGLAEGTVTAASVSEAAGATLQIFSGGAIDDSGDFAAGAGAASDVYSGATLSVGGGFTEAAAASTNVDGGTLQVTGDYVDGANGNLTVNGTASIGGAIIDSAGHVLQVGGGDDLTVGSVAHNADVSGAQATYNVYGSFTDKGAFSGVDDIIYVQGGDFDVEGTAKLGDDTFNLYQSAKVTLANLGAPNDSSQNVFNVDSTSSLEVGAANVAAAGQIAIDAGQTLTGSLGTSATQIVIDGVLESLSGEQQELDGQILGDGSVQIDGGGVYFNNAPIATTSLSVNFGAPGGTLSLNASAYEGSSGFAPIITNLAAGDYIEFVNLSSATIDTVAADGNGDTVVTLTGVDATTDATVHTKFTFQGAALDSSNDFFIGSGPNGSLAPALETSITPCFALGTRILTDRGEVAVEALVVGDLAVTAAGALRPIRWLGRRKVDLARHMRPTRVNPVRIEAGALAPNVPTRDLVVSPEHALWLDEAFVCAGDLINGATIRQEAWREVEYFHVELESHDILLAEGAPAESYLDCGNRDTFENGDGALTLHPQGRPSVDARRFASPAELCETRARLCERAAALGRSAALAAYRAYENARAQAPRENVVRNPRGEGAVCDRIGECGAAPVGWWFDAPPGVAIEIAAIGVEAGLPFVDIRFVGCAQAEGHCAIYPAPGTAIAAERGQDWSFSAHLRRVGGGWDGLGALNLYFDEYGPNGDYLDGEPRALRFPTEDPLALQRVSGTHRVRRRDTRSLTGYVQAAAEVGAAIDVTLRVAGFQIEQGGYASGLLVPPEGAFGPVQRGRPEVAEAA
jgi:plastocyanin